MPEEVKKEEETKEKKKGFFGKIKDAAEDNEGQLEAISTMVRLGILIWSGGILTLAYIKLPAALGIPEQKLDPTFIASVFTGVLATFGVQTAKKSGDGTMKMQNGAAGGAGGVGAITKADLERLIAAAKETAPAQVIRVEQAPIKIVTDSEQPPYKM
jgi:hypothetical protein